MATDQIVVVNQPLSSHSRATLKGQLIHYSLIHATLCVQLIKLQPAQVSAGWSLTNRVIENAKGVLFLYSFE